jgi:hypothetical protein
MVEAGWDCQLPTSVEAGGDGKRWLSPTYDDDNREGWRKAILVRGV